MNMFKIGTKVTVTDGCCEGAHGERIGQVADYVTDRWGTDHLVLIGGEFVRVGHISEVGYKGIGWRVASEADVARAARNTSRV
jgi:hypothetical protein